MISDHEPDGIGREGWPIAPMGPIILYKYLNLNSLKLNLRIVFLRRHKAAFNAEGDIQYSNDTGLLGLKISVANQVMLYP